MAAAMETKVQPKEGILVQKKDVKKRIHSGKRFSYGKTVQFPDWRINNDYNRTTQLIVSYKEGKKVSMLREPRNLYTLASAKYNHPVNTPRWPEEMKVVSERPHHLDSLPHEPEKFYNTDILADIPDTMPVLTKPEDGELVYDNMFTDSKYFDGSRCGGNGVERCHSINSSDTLCFESRFESGNLGKAVKIGPCDYQLWLRTDLYTEKYTQWYYFRVENTQPGNVYRFTIMNLMKSKSLYSCGMKPLMYSEQEAREKAIGWRRVGSNIKYYKNELKRVDEKGERSLYSLTWTVVFPHARDCCYFAHCYPYTYTDLQEYLCKLSKDPSRAKCCKQRTLTRTLAGNFVYLMTITNPSKCPLEAKKKRAVVLTARVHPGETNSSWMMKGLLDYLTSDTLDAKLLRDTFVFKVVPMLNPDGVIVGNYRCSLSGRDLNRNYKTTLKEAFPSVWHTREMIKRLGQEREIALYCDLHGHSRQQNVFIYGCENGGNLEHGFKERVFPMMMSKNCQDKFSFKRCKFKVQKSKSGTGRIVMWNLGIRNSYTMEATFCGSTLGSRAGEHFTTADFESMGYHLCDTLLDYYDPDMSKYVSILNEVEIYVKTLVLGRLKKQGVAEPDMKLSDVDLEKDYMSSGSSPSGSDSSVSDGLPMHVIYSKKDQPKKKKKRLKTRKERNKRRAGSWNKESKEKESTKKPEDSAEVSAKNTRSTDLPADRGKNSRASSHPRHKKTPSSPILHGTCKVPTTPEQFNEVKAQDNGHSTPDTNGQSKSPASFYGQSIPQIRYSGKQDCFGLAPVKPASSLNRWSVEEKKGNSSNVTNDETENSFIGRYMARQIRLTIHRKNIYKPSPENDQSEVVGKLSRRNGSYKMIATARAGDWEGRIEEVTTQKDRKEESRQYCARHSYILRKVNEKEPKKKEAQIFETKKLCASTGKISSSHDKVNGKNSHEDCLTLKQETETIETSPKEGESPKDGQKVCLDKQNKRSISDNNFPVVNVQRQTTNDRNRERRLFNFSGVIRKSTRTDYNLSREHRSSSSTDNSYFSFIDKEKQQHGSQTARLSMSDNSIAQPARVTRQELRKRSKSTDKALFCSEDDDLASNQNPPKAPEELAMEGVERLQKKMQGLNSPGRMVNFTLKNQVNEVENGIKKSLFEEYKNFQTKCYGGQPKTMFKNKTHNSTQKIHEKKNFYS